MSSNQLSNSLSLQPLGAGDLIDRTIRLYRKNFSTLIRIAALPVVVSAFGSVLFTIGWRETFTTAREASFAIYVLLMMAGFTLWAGGNLLLPMVMGGAARNLVRHLLHGEPISVGETYRNLRRRFFALLGSTLVVGFILAVAFFGVFYAWSILLLISIGGAALLGTASSALAFIVGVILSIATSLAAYWLFLLIAGRFVYVPQVLMVEGQGVFASIGRSASLASGNVKRLGALILFSTFATYSALMILLLPVGWYAQANGIPLFSWEPDQMPVWYSITLQVIWQLSFILLAPVWMMGLSLLYVDERVRHEAYDVELMAARQLAELPAQAAGVRHNPLRPALAQMQPPPSFTSHQQPSKITTLGLN